MPKPIPAPAEPRIIHTIDGIEEYDNPSPTWIVWLFYLTMAIAVLVQVLFPSWFGPGLLHWSQYSDYDQEMKTAQVAADHAAANTGGLATILHDPQAIAAGKQIFATNCAACHGAQAQGVIGPNLVKPPYWAYGNGKPEDLEHIVTNGTKKGMPTWGPILGKTKIDQAVAFVYSLEHPDGK